MVSKREFADRIKQQVQSLQVLPAMPGTATELILLKNDRRADMEDLAAIIDRDPSLAAQMMRYARLSAFGYGNRVTCTQKALSLVIGFDTGLHMALGLSLGKTLRMPPDGPLGLYAFWTHALHSAMLVQRIAAQLAPEQRPPLGAAYLAGLLHNFGFLLLGHLHPREFGVLNHMAEKKSEIPILELETHLLGVRHDELGVWLMQAWNLPEEIIVAVREHHYPDFDGRHAIYAKLVLAADRLLVRHGFGDAPTADLPPSFMASLGITEHQAQNALDAVLTMTPELTEMAMQIAA